MPHPHQPATGSVPPPPALAPPESSAALRAFSGWYAELKTPAALKRIGAQLGIVLAVPFVITLCLLGFLAALMESEFSSSEADQASLTTQSFGGFVGIMGLSLGGRIGMKAEMSGFFGSGAMSVGLSLTVVSISTIALIALANYLLLRKLGIQHVAAKTLGQRFAPMAGHALLLGLVTALLMLPGRLNFGSPGEYQVHLAASFWAILLSVFLVIFLSSALAATRGNRAIPLSARKVLSEAAIFNGTGLALFGLIAFVSLVVLAFRASDAGVSGTLALIPPVLGNLSVMLMGLSFFGALGMSGNDLSGFLPIDPSDYMPPSMRLWELFDGKGWWLVLATVLLVIFSALRIGIRRARTTKRINSSRIWQLPLATLVIWIVLASLASIRLSSDFSGSAEAMLGKLSFHGGLLWYSSIMVALGSLVVSVLAEVLPLWCYQLAPRLLVLCAGATATAQWIDPSHRAPQQAATARSEAPAAAVAPQAPSQAPAALDNPTPMAPATKRRLKGAGIAALAVAVLIGVGAGVVSYLNAQRKPEAQVEAYLHLLQEGKAAQANEMVNPGVDNAQRVLLSDEALAGAQQRLKFESARTLHVDDYAASVLASYSVNGEIITAEMSVERAEKEFGLLDRWKLSTPLLVPVSIQAPSESVEISGVQAPLQPNSENYFAEQENFKGEFFAFPGIYEVKGKSTDFITASTEPLRIMSNAEGNTHVEVTQELSSATSDLALKAVQDFATACVTPPTNMADGCPYELGQTDLASMKVMEQASGIEEINQTSFTALSTKFKYKKNNTEYSDYEPEDLETTFHGTIEWDNGTPKITKVSSGWF
ncbi:hypothetical protein [Glutamicibacter arilaitensis]|uniref:hypothetical protein n=1 Tax=Glutamicibacter arilaitensis TaxID=256701 RepID=UPI00384B03DE